MFDRVTCFALSLLACIAAADETTRLPAHQIVIQEAVGGLPPEIAPVFASNIEQLQRSVTEPADNWPKVKNLRYRNRWHNVDADLNADRNHPDTRQDAARAFPRDKTAAQHLYRKVGRHRGGFLPWAVAECYQNLVDAFEAKDHDAILSWAGYLAHFAADAADPFRCSVGSVTQASAPLTFGHDRSPHPRARDHSASRRWSGGLVARRAWDYASRIELTPDHREPPIDPLHAAFAEVHDALAVLDAITDADRDIMKHLGIVDRATFNAHREDYYRALHDRCADLVTARLRAGARLAANLIGGAWRTAGHPTATEILARADTARAERGAPGALTLVGSKGSVIFHKRDCPFTARIAVENLVRFTSARDARTHGRRPCKHCRPD